jgi:hypothetical protein
MLFLFPQIKCLSFLPLLYFFIYSSTIFLNPLFVRQMVRTQRTLHVFSVKILLVNSVSISPIQTPLFHLYFRQRSPYIYVCLVRIGFLIHCTAEGGVKCVTLRSGVIAPRSGGSSGPLCPVDRFSIIPCLGLGWDARRATRFYCFVSFLRPVGHIRNPSSRNSVNRDTTPTSIRIFILPG